MRSNIIIGCKGSKDSKEFHCVVTIRIRFKVCLGSGPDSGLCTDPNVHGFHSGYAY
jgi:hypothetical protein